MKVTKTIGNLTVEFEGETQKDIFKQLSSLEEVFGEKVCGKCGSENLRFIVRENDGNEFYELRCLDCGAKLAFGAHKKGGKNGTPKPNLLNKTATKKPRESGA